MIKATPGIQRIVSLCDEMKLLASDVLSYVDADQDFQRKTMIPRSHYNERQSFDASMEMVREIKHSAMAENLINEESICFEDAQSHVSESELEEMKQIEIIIKTPVMADRPHRDRLPHLRDPNEKINIWQIVKDSIGKELSRITVPVYFNEPISFIQRFSEDLSYNEILVRAADHPDPLMRLALVASFAVTSYTSSEWRTMKPFNPLLGETFELERDGFHLVTEQVSHHPPISALHCDHQKYTFWASTHVKTSFKGTHLRVDPEGTHHLILKPHNDHFT